MCLPFAKSSILDNSRAQARDVFANLIAATFLQLQSSVDGLFLKNTLVKYLLTYDEQY